MTAGASDSSCSRKRCCVRAASCPGAVPVGSEGFRVYPPWVTTTNRQACSTQAWQVNYFLCLREDRLAEVERAKALYHR
ncbi:MepB family protein [Nocardia sp. CA-129566]|uniref:MepB family protein n=1 Tax=Nocardia sp. CA-129566 TaxID=3239976 RepID=UPI003D985FDD